MNKNFDEILFSLSKSKFRSSFHLNKKLIVYVEQKGIDVVETHAYDIIKSRLAGINIQNDGKQTPMRQVHPVFVAQHATATCCRGCLQKWYGIPKNRELTQDEVSFIVNIIISWIKKEVLH